MVKPDNNGEFGYRRDMREWERQARILRAKVAAAAIGILCVLYWLVTR